MKAQDLARFMRKVQSVDAGYETECLEWTACVNPKDYGQFKLNGKRVLSHRALFEHVNGKIAEGLVLDHKCRNHRCSNPAHLEPVTIPVNNARGWQARAVA